MLKVDCIFVGGGHFRLTSFIIYVGYFLSVDFKWIMQYDFLKFLLPHLPPKFKTHIERNKFKYCPVHLIFKVF